MNEETSQSEMTSFATVKFSVADNMLIAAFSKDSIDAPLTEDACKQQLFDDGFEKHQLESDMLTRLTTLSEDNHQGDIQVEEHTDATFSLNIDNKKMTARISIQPAKGGEDLEYEAVLESLIEQSVNKDFIDTDLLTECISSIKEETPIIAKGIPAIKGTDTKFETLYQSDSVSAPEQDKDGAINHFETHDYISVNKDQPLLRKIPFTKGTDGINVLGETITAEDGLDINFTLDDTVKLDKADLNLMLAAKSGHPLAIENGVHVDDTLTLKNANLSSGNIHFDGSVHIQGEVKPNVVIEASGDIYVGGMVENANLIAGNNIIVKAGIFSRQPDENSSSDKINQNCLITAEGTFYANYCNGVNAKAKKDILIENYAMQSHIESDGSIIVGVNNGNGVIIGGYIFARQGITANVIGSDAYVNTKVVCGSYSSLKKDYMKRKKDIVNLTKELSALNAILTKIKKSGSPTSVGKVVLQKAKEIHREINTVKKNRRQMKTNLAVAKKLLKAGKKIKIKVIKNLYSNVHITINGAQELNTRDRGPSDISCAKNEIQFN